MSIEKFDDNCPGCKPAFIHLETGKVLPDDHPVMQRVFAVWRATTFQEREAFHDVMCLNSRDPLKLFLVKQVTERFE